MFVYLYLYSMKVKLRIWEVRFFEESVISYLPQKERDRGRNNINFFAKNRVEIHYASDMGSSQLVPGLSDEGDRVADIRPANLGCKFVVASSDCMNCPWISKDATSMELVLQDREGDRIHCSIGRAHVGIFKTVIRESGTYSMQNFVIQMNVKSPRTTPHQYKLSFYAKTEVRTLASTTFQFSRFRFMPFPEIEAMPGQNDQFQIDCIGYVVAKEDPKDMVTKDGLETTCMSLYLEDLEGNKMKCTVFEDLVGKLVQLAAKDDVQPLIVVAQLFKPCVYLNETYIQNTRYVSKVFLNPEFPEVIAFRDRLVIL
ncbi:hypothetical protein PIB30_054285 [Stylosanthes scabra]|uniref:Replication protein A 70 kDa DNA-binding subunit B/D first OB fold domain-containing protein n=1 Tax=Stylosanthes scabra TaxID=79078 RepID=A0ABU6WLI1_9FABA|nr:hypothetical protein [Stylosanthes scabra]